MTIEQIANLAKVSKTTVSRVINDKPDVNPKTRRIIKDIIEEFGYQPNASAKAIAQQRIFNIGLIIPYEAEYIFSNPFYVDVLRGIYSELDKEGYYLLLCYPHERNYIDLYTQKRVDGFIILSPSIEHKKLINLLIEKNVPFVSTSILSDIEGIPSVDVDNYLGGILAAEHLISLGHREIGFIGKKLFASSNERLRGLRDTLKKYGIIEKPGFIKHTSSASAINGYKLGNELLDAKDRPSAIFVSSDVMAMGVLKACHERNIRIPEEISIIGFDNLKMSETLYPSLSTVMQPAYEKGCLAAKMIIEYVEENKKPEVQMLSLSLIQRESTGRCLV